MVREAIEPGDLTQPATAVPVETAQRRRPDLSVLNTDVLPMMIAEAGRALGWGRTKINDLMKSGRLDRREIDGGVRITVASVKALAGVSPPVPLCGRAWL